MSQGRSREKGMRRGQMKRFSSSIVNTGKSANSLVVGEYNARARTLSTPPSEANYSNNEAHYLRGRSLVLEPAECIINGTYKELWQSDFWQGYVDVHRVNLILNPERGNLFLFISGNRFFFVKETPNRAQRWITERSLVYPTREIAFRHYRTATICWVKARAVGQSILEKSVGPKLDLEKFT